MKNPSRSNTNLHRTLLVAALFLIVSGARSIAQDPIRLHPDSPRYFNFHQKPVVLVGSSEHYGALINLDFDYIPYLDEVRSRGLNLIRIFSGTYREATGSFGIQDNTLAPPTARFIAPWKRTATAGAADGGTKFDLSQWDPAYFNRLRSLVSEAGSRGIIVELTFYSAIYDDNLWKLSPMNSANHINGVGSGGRINCYSSTSDLLAYQKSLVRKCATELNAYDNVIYETCNEPYNGSVSSAWENQIIDELTATEASLPVRHLIARNVANYQGVISNPHPAVSILNFHYAYPEAASQNQGLNRAIGDDETGFAGQTDFPYRREAWEFMMSGGALFDHLDFSFTTAREDGMALQSAPGGGGPAIRRQLGVLRRFMENLPLVQIAPQPDLVAGGIPSGGAARAIGLPGKKYGVYLRGGSQANLILNLPAATYQGDWIDTKTGAVAGSIAAFSHAGGQRTLASPIYQEDIALRLTGEAPPAPGPQLAVNGSFELNYTAWNASGNQAILTGGTDGTKALVFNGANQVHTGVVSQTVPTRSGVTYTLAFDVGVLSYNTNQQQLQITVTGNGTLLSHQIVITGLGNGTVRWVPQVFTFVADSDSTLLTFKDRSTTTQSIDLLLDHVRVYAPPTDNGLPPETTVLGPATLLGIPGSIVVQIAATQPGTYFLQRSVDLITWETVGEITITQAGTIDFPHSESQPNAMSFYRIGLRQ
ncbi:MAG: cellulase family glycosylhydrolase [Luteolibacter sp.]|uniref:cellulase family glycosylhydrolase n=1 Tax=Luteolibacter sp. TaxID=1962973 RepID=UPI0032648BAE